MDDKELLGLIFMAVQEIVTSCAIYLNMVAAAHKQLTQQHKRRIHRRIIRYKMADRIPSQISYLRRIVDIGDAECVNNLRMTRNAFARLCYLMEHVGGLTDSKYVNIQEKVAMFLAILGHHKKNRIIRHDYLRSGHTVSKSFHDVLSSILKLHHILLVEPAPIPAESTNEKWKYFKGCLGALDGTHISVHVRENEQARYRTRKGITTVNVLGVCDRDMKFVYVLPGWEGSAADSRVLRDALARPNGLKVPRGCYYLCDNGYANAEGFLTPYKKVRYHLKSWGSGTSSPQNYKEYFNMKHASARNVIERTFGILKKRWAVLRSPSFYGIKVQNRMILACTLLHNFIRSEMPVDPLEDLTEEETMNNDNDEPQGYINELESSSQWQSWKDNLARTMYNEWRGVP